MATPFWDSKEAYDMAAEELEKKVNEMHQVIMGVNGHLGLIH